MKNWLNKPQEFEITKDNITIYSEFETDFWQKTHYNFEHDNGHFLYFTSDLKNFTLECDVIASPLRLYDQAGLCFRVDANNWIKVSAEYMIDSLYIGSVVTNLGYSDWSTTPIDKNLSKISYKVVKSENDFMIYAKIYNDYYQIRMAHLHNIKEPLMVGIYTCSPTKPDSDNPQKFKAVFSNIKFF